MEKKYLNYDDKELIKELELKIKDLRDSIEILNEKIKRTNFTIPLISLSISIGFLGFLVYVMVNSIVVANISISDYFQVFLILLAFLITFFIYYNYNIVKSLKSKKDEIKILRIKAKQIQERSQFLIKSLNPELL